MRRKIFIVLTIIWMIVIFVFSAKEADDSARASNEVGLIIGTIFVPGFEDKSFEEQMEFADMIDHPVRKTAHAMEYAILGFLVIGIIYGLKLRVVWQAIIAWALSTLYAASDEFHQTFVVGRSGELKDVGLDSAGALAGVLVGILIFKMYYNRRAKKKEREQLTE